MPLVRVPSNCGTITYMGTMYDLSVPLTGSLPVWAGDPPVVIERVMSMAAGHAYNLTRLELSAHAGTHVDAPNHVLDGTPGMEDVPLTALVGPCLVWEAPGSGPISAELLRSLPEGVERVLVKTGLGRWWETRPPRLPDDFRALTPDAARLLVDRNLKLVGIDSPSIEAPDSGNTYPVHCTLLGAGITVVEALNLTAVPPGSYRLLCLPLLVPGADGAPARAVLLEDV